MNLEGVPTVAALGDKVKGIQESKVQQLLDPASWSIVSWM